MATQVEYIDAAMWHAILPGSRPLVKVLLNGESVNCVAANAADGYVIVPQRNVHDRIFGYGGEVMYAKIYGKVEILVG